MGDRSMMSGKYSQVRGSYSRQLEGETRNSSSVVKETKRVKLIKSSVKEHPKSTREVSRNVYETIKGGAPAEQRMSENVTTNTLDLRKEVPKIVEKIVEVPFTVEIKKPVPNYIYKDVVTEVRIETNRDRIIENDIEETIEREVENVTEQEKITEVVQEVEHVQEKRVYVDKEPQASGEEADAHRQEPKESGHGKAQGAEMGETQNSRPIGDQIDENMLEKVSVKEEDGVEYRTYYVKVLKDKVVDVEEIEYKEVEVEKIKNKEIENIIYKDVEKEQVEVFEVEEEEIVIEKKDRVVDVYQDKEEIVERVVKVPKIRKVQVFKDVEIEKEVIEEVPVEVIRDKEVIKVREVEVPRTVEVPKEVQKDVYENTEKPEYIQKIFEKERELEVNITKMKPKYKEVPIERFEDVEVSRNEYRAVEQISTVNKKKDVVIPKIVEKIVQVPRVVEKMVEKEVEQVKYVTVPVYRDVIKKREVPVIVEKRVEVPVKKYVEKEVFREVKKQVEIEVIEENPIIIEQEEENVINVDVAAQSLRENLEIRNLEKQRLQEEAYVLKRELRKSQQRNQERRRSQKKYKYLGKEENTHLRKELTQLHREYRDVVQKNTAKQISEMKNSEIVKVIDRRKMDVGTVEQLKKSGVIKPDDINTAPATSGFRSGNQAHTESRILRPETERIMNETIKTYKTIGSQPQLGRSVLELQDTSMHRRIEEHGTRISRPIEQNPTNPQSIASQRNQSSHSHSQNIQTVQESGTQRTGFNKISRTSTKRSIKLDSYKSKDFKAIRREKSQNSSRRLLTQPKTGVSVTSFGSSEKYSRSLRGKP